MIPPEGYLSRIMTMAKGERCVSRLLGRSLHVTLSTDIPALAIFSQLLIGNCNIASLLQNEPSFDVYILLNQSF
jgi:hypothetical protein